VRSVHHLYQRSLFKDVIPVTQNAFFCSRVRFCFYPFKVDTIILKFRTADGPLLAFFEAACGVLYFIQRLNIPCVAVARGSA
jgi:hypothetical protein